MRLCRCWKTILLITHQLIFISFPVSTLSDKDRDDEDSPETMNHLSVKQLSAPAEVVIRTQQEFESSDDDAEVQNDHKKCVPKKKSSRRGKCCGKIIGSTRSSLGRLKSPGDILRGSNTLCGLQWESKAQV